jgi:hypothetical protein
MKTATMTEEEITTAKAKIDKLTQLEMARLWRFAPAGHPYFSPKFPLSDYFDARFRELGGMTLEISKAIGW